MLLHFETTILNNLILTEEENNKINELFIKQRKILKGIAEPFKLLKKIESVALSLKNLLGDSQGFYLIEEYFTKAIIN